MVLDCCIGFPSRNAVFHFFNGLYTFYGDKKRDKVIFQTRAMAVVFSYQMTTSLRESLTDIEKLSFSILARILLLLS